MTSWTFRKNSGATVGMFALSLLIVLCSWGQSGTAAKPATEQIAPAASQDLSAGKGVLVDTKGGIRINPAAVRSYLTGSASLSHGAIAGNGGCSSQPVPVTGAVIGDRVVVGPPAELLTYSLAMTYAVSAADTVTIRLCNYTSSTITPPTWTWNVDVVKSF